MNELFGFLFARPSFLEGMARALDLGGTLQEYNTSLSGEQADSLAVGADWRVIGNDLRRAMSNLADEEQVQITENLLSQARACLDTTPDATDPKELVVANGS